MDILKIFTTLTLVTITSLYWGSFLSLRLPDIHKRFDRKPFNCRPCFTFHLTWILSLFSSLVLWCEYVFVLGVVLSFVVFAVVKIIDNKKIIK